MPTATHIGSDRVSKEKETRALNYNRARKIKGRARSLSTKPYVRFPKIPLEQKIELYLSLLADGWGLSIARANSGLKQGRADYGRAMQDRRVVAAQAVHREQLIEKQRGKFG